MPRIKNLTNITGTVVYPKTSSDAVDVNGTILTDILNDKADKTAIPSLDGYATETFVTKKISEASLSGGEVDLSDLATKDELALKADTSSIPTKTSQLTNDSGFIESIPSEYVTETELNDKGYLTSHQDISGKANKTYVDEELDKKSDKTHNHDTVYAPITHEHEQYLTSHQDISMKADKSDLHTHDNKTVLDSITSNKVTEWDNKSNFDGNYNSLSNKPTIPTVDVDKKYVDNQLETKANKSEIPSLDGYATETFVTTKIAEASLSGKEVDLSGLATKDELKSKADKTYVDAELAKKANESHTHSYNDLTDTPSIPSIDGLATKKELTDGLATKANESHNHDKVYAPITHEHKQYLTSHQDLSDYATKDDLNTKADKTAIPTKVSQLTNDKGYLTEHQDISMKADKTELHSHSNKTVLDGITSAKVDEWNNKSTFDGNYNSLTNKPTIPTVPTKTSELTNDSGFIKSIPSEYVTETELNDKGYLTAHQDISGKVDKVSGKGLSTNDLTDALKSKYDTAYTHSQSAHFSGSYDDLKNRPTIPSAYVLPQASADNLGGIKVGTGLAVSDEGKLSLDSHSHAITDVTNLQAELSKKANTADLKTVATTGSYNDLTGIPTIPTSLPANGGNANTVGGISLAIKTLDQYTALETKSDTTLYIILDGGKIYLGSTLIAEVNPTQTV